VIEYSCLFMETVLYLCMYWLWLLFPSPMYNLSLAGWQQGPHQDDMTTTTAGSRWRQGFEETFGCHCCDTL